MIDAHCHVMHERFDLDRREVLSRARQKLTAIVETGGNLLQNEQALILRAQNKKFIHAAIGVAPHYANETDLKKEFEFIERNYMDAIAIGEIGLEYHYFKEEPEREKQRIVFREQLILAEKLQLPVVIHCREAWDDLLAILSDFPQQKVMLHFFNKPQLLKEALRRGYWISLATLKSKDLWKIMRDCPINSMLAETDSPFLWAEGRNEPTYVTTVYDKIAEIKKTDLEGVRQTIMANASKFFEIPF